MAAYATPDLLLKKPFPCSVFAVFPIFAEVLLCQYKLLFRYNPLMASRHPDPFRARDADLVVFPDLIAHPPPENIRPDIAFIPQNSIYRVPRPEIMLPGTEPRARTPGSFLVMHRRWHTVHIQRPGNLRGIPFLPGHSEYAAHHFRSLRVGH